MHVEGNMCVHGKRGMKLSTFAEYIELRKMFDKFALRVFADYVE
jgi:hypothetical protein